MIRRGSLSDKGIGGERTGKLLKIEEEKTHIKGKEKESDKKKGRVD